MKTIQLPLLSAFLFFIAMPLLPNILDDLQADPRYKIEIYASGLNSPRQLAESADGWIFIGSRSGGTIFAVKDTDGNGESDTKSIVAEDLSMATGVSLFNGDLYFSEINKIWKIENIEEQTDSIKCIMKYLSQDMEENYPGNLDCTVTYELNNNNELLIDFGATSDKDTIVNMTNHNYWNFHGHGDSYQNNEDHVVCIDSKSICETDEQSIPTGKILKVEESKFDLQKDFLINKDFLSSGGIDHNYILEDQTMKESVAKIYSKKTRLGVEYFTNQNGIQFYTGNMMLDKYVGKHDKSYGFQYGMCLEPQHFPDAINHQNFPSPILRKNKNYLSKIKIKLRNNF